MARKAAVTWGVEMDASDVVKVVAEHLPRLQRELGLVHWTFRVRAEFLTSDDPTFRRFGNVLRDVSRERAHVEINPDEVENAVDVVRVLRHEMFHCVLAPFDLYAEAVEKFVSDKTALESVRRVWEHACEQAVVGLERLCGEVRLEPKSKGRRAVAKVKAAQDDKGAKAERKAGAVGKAAAPKSKAGAGAKAAGPGGGKGKAAKGRAS